MGRVEPKAKRNNPPRVTYSGLKVLRAFLDAYERSVRGTLTGAEIMRLARISSGTLYPLVFRFEDAGLLESTWEAGDPRTLARPLRRFYRLTPDGAEFARNALETVAPSLLHVTPDES